jgi:hypothetical protein
MGPCSIRWMPRSNMPHHDLEREASRGRIGQHDLSDRVKLTQAAMKIVESQLERLPHLDKWFVDIECPSPASRDS